MFHTSPRLFAASLLLLPLAGCTVARQSTTAASSTDALHGVVHGGQQPVTGSVVRLMAPGLTGYGSAPSTLATAISDGGGGFTLPAYTCPANNGLVYLQVTGGNAGAGPNTAIDEVALLGKCSSLSPSTFIIVSEATTVAAAYALAPFASVTATATGIGTSPGNLQGLTNAFGPANNLADFHTGNARATTSVYGMVLPTTTVNSLANTLAACINTTTPITPTPCTTLFAATTVNSVVPIDTFQAALNIALHPGSQVNNLYNLSTASAPFQPALSSAPSDYTLAIAYNGGSIGNGGGTTGVAIDAAGNAWVAGGFFSSTHVLTEIDPFGNYISGTVGYGSSNLTSPLGVAIDLTGNVDVANPAANNVVKFTAGGAYLATITASSFANPNGLSLGVDGNLYVSNHNGNKLTRILTSTLTEDPAGIFTTGAAGIGVAANSSAVWISNYSASTVSSILTGSANVNSYAPGGMSNAMALDATGDAWTTLYHGVAKLSPTGTVLSGAGFATNSAHYPQDMTFDGLNHAWVSSNRNNVSPGTLIELGNDGTVLSSNDGYLATGVIPILPAVPNGIEVDGSGNIWMTGYPLNSSGSVVNAGSVVVEIIGIAAPVTTPRMQAAVNNTIGMRP